MIDADKVKQFPYSPESGTEDMVEAWIYECGLYNLELYVTDDCPVDVEQALKDLCRKIIEGFINIIDTEPTAYNPEKVAEELQERSKEYNSGVRLHGKPEEMLTHEAVEIVRMGGVE